MDTDFATHSVYLLRCRSRWRWLDRQRTHALSRTNNIKALVGTNVTSLLLADHRGGMGKG